MAETESDQGGQGVDRYQPVERKPHLLEALLQRKAARHLPSIFETEAFVPPSHSHDPWEERDYDREYVRRQQEAARLYGPDSPLTEAWDAAFKQGPVTAEEAHQLLLDNLRKGHDMWHSRTLKGFIDKEHNKYVLILEGRDGLALGVIFNNAQDLRSGAITIKGRNEQKNAQRMLKILEAQGMNEQDETSKSTPWVQLHGYMGQMDFIMGAPPPEYESDVIEEYDSWDEFETRPDSSVRLVHATRAISELLAVVENSPENAVQMITAAFQVNNNRLEMDARVVAEADDDGDTHMMSYLLKKVDTILRQHGSHLGSVIDLNQVRYEDRLGEFQEEAEHKYEIARTIFSLQRAAQRGSEREIHAIAQRAFVDSTDFERHVNALQYHDDSIDWFVGLCVVELNSALEEYDGDLSSLMEMGGSQNSFAVNFLSISVEKAYGIYYDHIKKLIGKEDGEDGDYDTFE